MRNSLSIILSRTAFWQAVNLAGTASVVAFPLLFFGTIFDCVSGVPSLFLLPTLMPMRFGDFAVVLDRGLGALKAVAEMGALLHQLISR